MFKSFILTLTVAMLGSVAYCQGPACDEATAATCTGFCTKTQSDYNDVGCQVKSYGTYCYGTAKVVDLNDDNSCKPETMKLCNDLYPKTARVKCDCLGAVPTCALAT